MQPGQYALLRGWAGSILQTPVSIITRLVHVSMLTRQYTCTSARLQSRLHLHLHADHEQLEAVGRCRHRHRRRDRGLPKPPKESPVCDIQEDIQDSEIIQEEPLEVNA